MKQKSIIAIIFSVLLLVARVEVASAQIINPASGYLINVGNFGDLAAGIINWMLLFAAGVIVVFLLVGGVRYIMARGNEEGMEKAKKTISGAIIGLIIILMAFAIVTIISDVVTRNPGEVVVNPPPEPDGDHDGVIDRWDNCPTTPPGTPVGSDGCPPPPPQPQCNDNWDNDGDLRTDFPNDLGCADETDNNETDPIPPPAPPPPPPPPLPPPPPPSPTPTPPPPPPPPLPPPPPPPQCSDLIDNDGDFTIDFGSGSFNDPGCTSLADNDETNPPPPLFYFSRFTGPFSCTPGVNNDVFIGEVIGGVKPYFWYDFTPAGLPSPSYIFIDGEKTLAIACRVPADDPGGTARPSVTIADSSIYSMRVSFDISW